MGRVWSDQRRYETWLQVEIAATDAMARASIVPADAARDIRERAAFDVARIEAIEQITQHDVIAFTTAVAEHVGPSARWLHFGLTSSDVVDTAQALQMREACDLILKGLDALMHAVRTRADEHRRTPMIGRTHGVHAEPMTFGLKLALWYSELGRDVVRVRRARDVVSVGKLSGAVGTFAHVPPAIEVDVCRSLGLESAAVSSQVIQRDRHAELLSTLGRDRLLDREVRARNTGVAEDRDRRSRGGRSRRDRRGRRPCRISAIRSAVNSSLAWRGCFAPTRARRSRTTHCGTSATSRIRPSSA